MASVVDDLDEKQDDLWFDLACGSSKDGSWQTVVAEQPKPTTTPKPKPETKLEPKPESSKPASKPVPKPEPTAETTLVPAKEEPEETDSRQA